MKEMGNEVKIDLRNNQNACPGLYPAVGTGIHELFRGTQAGATTSSGRMMTLKVVFTSGARRTET